MSVLPVSVRLALWATAAYAGRLPIEEVVAKAHPDIDHVAGELDHLSLWHDLGERAVLVALPRPGKLSGMPRGSAELIAAATDAGECIFVPGLGGHLGQPIGTFGSSAHRAPRGPGPACAAERAQGVFLRVLPLEGALRAYREIHPLAVSHRRPSGAELAARPKECALPAAAG